MGAEVAKQPRVSERELNNKGFDGVVTDEVIREGKKAEEILKQIDDDEDVSVQVLGASTEAAGPGPLVAAFTGATIPIPVSIVPGDSPIEDIKAAGVSRSVVRPTSRMPQARAHADAAAPL
jgi:hypothetical protein